jgi:hypothetical protein
MARRQLAVAPMDLARATELNEEPRDRPLDPWRRPASEKAVEIVRWVTSIFEQREKLRCPRQRRRRPADQTILEETVAALICDAVHRELTAPSGRVLIPEEAAPQFRDDVAPRNGMMPPPDSEMIAPPITE